MILKNISKLKQVKGEGYLSVKIITLSILSPCFALQVKTPTLFGSQLLYVYKNPLSEQQVPYTKSINEISSLLDLSKSGCYYWTPLLIPNNQQRLLARQFLDVQNLMLLFNLAIQDEVIRYKRKQKEYHSRDFKNSLLSLS